MTKENVGSFTCLSLVSQIIILEPKNKVYN